MKKRLATMIAIVFCFGMAAAGNAEPAKGEKKVINGYVLDSACLFTRNLKKPISSQCALECAGGGSPLVILADDDTVYLPIDSKMPAQGQNFRLITVAGKFVKISGTVYERGSSKAIVMDSIEESKEK